MAKDLSALKSAIKVVADVVNDLSSGSLNLAKFQNVLPDIIVMLPQLGSIPQQAKDLELADYEALIAEMSADLAIESSKMKAIVDASFPVINDLLKMLPDLAALFKALKA